MIAAFITLHDSTYRTEYVINIAEISSIAGDKESGTHFGANVSMRNGDRFHTHEGTEEIAKMMRQANEAGR